MTHPIPNVLTIAGSDSGGGAGIQADLKTFSALGAYGASVITALTAQNTRGVTGVHAPDAAFVTAQLDAVFDDIRIDAVKIGMLANAAIVHAVADALRRYTPRYVVLDTVMISKSAHALLAPDAVDALAEAAWRRFGGVDLLFNNAGVMATGFSWEITPERFERSFAINVHGVLNGIRSFVPRMLERNVRAHIVNTASVGGFLPSPLMSPYSASKFAVVALTESLYGELKMLGAPVGVSLLAPGPVQSAIFSDPFGDTLDRPEVRGFVDTMRTMLSAHGLTPDAFAERVFDGIRDGRYWLIPQPETIDGALQRRTADILAARDPSLPSF
ncbi:SDR family NAD(P)-dependent oxidoreductase [Paraburkholderia sp. Se-20369]|nr:SDR family NAD(P)-dependent oxidoreductase [Paraburkholderia sp. Se-20369]